ncbi:MAG: TonB family protein, partial [Prochlorothrix sp.]|nr:TonB family protein [Prochlorothrix sp.]
AAPTVAPTVASMPQQPWPFAQPRSSVPERFSPSGSSFSPSAATASSSSGSVGVPGSSPVGAGRGPSAGSVGSSQSAGSAKTAGSAGSAGLTGSSGLAGSVGPTGAAATAPSAAIAAPKAAVPVPKSAQTPPQFDITPYLQNVKRQVDRQWHSGQQVSQVVVLFRIGRSGELRDLSLAQPSGNAQADAAAIAAVRNAAPAFGPIPAAYGPDSVSVSLTLIQD